MVMFLTWDPQKSEMLQFCPLYDFACMDFHNALSDKLDLNKNQMKNTKFFVYANYYHSLSVISQGGGS